MEGSNRQANLGGSGDLSDAGQDDITKTGGLDASLPVPESAMTQGQRGWQDLEEAFTQKGVHIPKP